MRTGMSLSGATWLAAVDEQFGQRRKLRVDQHRHVQPHSPVNSGIFHAGMGAGVGVAAGGLPGVGVGREVVGVVPVARKPVSHPILRTCRSRQ
jgi:hypothetical protein